MKEKIVIITGANSGIGKAATMKFAKEGHIVVMACRSMRRSRKVQEEIITVTKNHKIYLEEVDLSSFKSIRSFCSAFIGQYEKLDVLVHNAAYFNHGEKHQLSPDNIELTFATNVFGPFLMTKLLLDQLKKSEDPRILHAGSNIIKHFFSPKKEIEFTNLQGKSEESHSVYKMYCNSKMALVMLTFKMAEEFEEYGIKVNVLQINGARMSKETIKKFSLHWRAIAWIQNLFFPLPEVMANHYFNICTSDKFKNVTGQLINHKEEVMQSAKQGSGFITELKQNFDASIYPLYARNQEIADKLWYLCTKLTKNKKQG